MEQGRLHRLLAHHVRRTALERMAADDSDAISPDEVAGEFELHPGTVSYHMRYLEHVGAIELVHAVPRHGGHQHFYRLAAPGQQALEFLWLFRQVIARAQAKAKRRRQP